MLRLRDTAPEGFRSRRRSVAVSGERKSREPERFAAPGPRLRDPRCHLLIVSAGSLGARPPHGGAAHAYTSTRTRWCATSGGRGCGTARKRVNPLVASATEAQPRGPSAQRSPSEHSNSRTAVSALEASAATLRPANWLATRVSSREWRLDRSPDERPVAGGCGPVTWLPATTPGRPPRRMTSLFLRPSTRSMRRHPPGRSAALRSGARAR